MVEKRASEVRSLATLAMLATLWLRVAGGEGVSQPESRCGRCILASSHVGHEDGPLVDVCCNLLMGPSPATDMSARSRTTFAKRLKKSPVKRKVMLGEATTLRQPSWRDCFRETAGSDKGSLTGPPCTLDNAIQSRREVSLNAMQ